MDKHFFFFLPSRSAYRPNAYTLQKKLVCLYGYHCFTTLELPINSLDYRQNASCQEGNTQLSAFISFISTFFVSHASIWPVQVSFLFLNAVALILQIKSSENIFSPAACVTADMMLGHLFNLPPFMLAYMWLHMHALTVDPRFNLRYALICKSFTVTLFPCSFEIPALDSGCGWPSLCCSMLHMMFWSDLKFYFAFLDMYLKQINPTPKCGGI